MSKRFIVEHEAGSDYGIFDTKRRVKVATGLAEDEAEETAQARNKTEEMEIKDL